MKWWRWYILLMLMVLPSLMLMGFGFYFLWQSGWGWLLGWLLLGCILTSYILANFWFKQKRLLLPFKQPATLHTDRDKTAWKVVEEHAERVTRLNNDALLLPTTYITMTENLALDISRHFHPKASDPISALTIPEILTVIELATGDLAKMVDQYLPGGHVLTVRDFRRLKTASDWYPTVQKIVWVFSAIFSPINTAARYMTSQAGLSKPWQMLQGNVLVWFYTAFVHRLGHYLIELQSGKLKVGAERYRELQSEYKAERTGGESPAIKIVLLGQTNVGKSSLINALLGENAARTDVLPATSEATEYVLKASDTPELRLIDTTGYGTHGPTEKQWKHTLKEAQAADIVFVVLHATQPGRQLDLEQLGKLKQYFKEHTEMVLPPIVAVLTHIDLLSPMMEWAPPYDWQQPSRAKEKSIHQAVETVRNQFGPLVEAVVPVCASVGKVFGITEFLLPVMTSLMGQAKSVALVRTMNREANEEKVKRVFEQLLAMGKLLLMVSTRR